MDRENRVARPLRPQDLKQNKKSGRKEDRQRAHFSFSRRPRPIHPYGPDSDNITIKSVLSSSLSPIMPLTTHWTQISNPKISEKV